MNLHSKETGFLDTRDYLANGLVDYISLYADVILCGVKQNDLLKIWNPPFF